MRILIADDHAVLRRGLKQILALEFAGAIFGEAGTYEDMPRLTRNPGTCWSWIFSCPGEAVWMC